MDFSNLGQVLILILLPVLLAVANFIAAWLKKKTDEMEKRRGTKK